MIKTYIKTHIKERDFVRYDPKLWQRWYRQRKITEIEVTYEEKSILGGLIKWTTPIGERVIKEGEWEYA